MYAALKEMFTLGKPRDLKLAALEDSRARYLDSRKSSGAFRHGVLSRRVQPGDETAAEFSDFRESVRLAALIDCAKDGSFLYCH